MFKFLNRNKDPKPENELKIKKLEEDFDKYKIKNEKTLKDIEKEKEELSKINKNIKKENEELSKNNKKLKEKFKKRPIERHITLTIIGILLGIIGIVSQIALTRFFKPTTSLNEIFYSNVINLIITFSQVIIVGVIISFIMDASTMLRYFKEVLFGILTHDTYLDEMEDERVYSLREKCSKRIYKEYVEDFPDGVEDIDIKIMKSFVEKFVKFQTTDINLEDMGTYYKKTTIQTTEIINPKKTDETIELKFPVLLDDIPSVERKIEYIKLVPDEDDSKSVSHTDCEIEKEPVCTPDCHYKTKSYLKYPVKISFKKKLIIHSKDISYLPKNDRIYSMQVNLPTKQFFVTFTLKTNEKNDLIGQIFGTLLKNCDWDIKKESKKVIINTNNWLLPGNGMVFVIIPEENPEENKKE